MQVAVVAERTSPYADGTRRDVARVERTARDLAAAGHEVTVYCTGWWNHRLDDTERREREGVEYRAVTVAPATSAYRTRIPGLLALARPDAVHVHAGTPGAVLAARAGATLARAPLVVDWFGDPVPTGRLVARSLRATDRVVTPSELVERRVRERGVDERTASVIPEALAMEQVRAAPVPADPPDVVFAAPLDDTANLESLLLALAEHRDRGFSATVFGDGPERADYEAQAADLSIDDRVRFVGDATREDRLAAYRGAHVFAQTATSEVFATELLWALACGCVGLVEYQADSAGHELVEQHPRGFRASTPEDLEDVLIEAADLPRWDLDESFARYDRAAVARRWLDCYRAAGATSSGDDIEGPGA